MKKFLSLILALTMVACMSVTAFAADGTTVLTAQIPEAPDYELIIPANTTLDPTNTMRQAIGTVDVKNVSDKVHWIELTMPYTDLTNTEDSTDTIYMALYATSDADIGGSFVYKNGAVGKQDYWTIYQSLTDHDVYKPLDLSVRVEDWSGATPGATYQATITYVVNAVLY